MEENKFKNGVILSICIPTYNRAQLLKMAIESVLAQVDRTIVDEMEIVISDNASTDETAAVVAQLKSGTNLAINYFKNERNLGFDSNVLLVVEHARGRFAWILGDDDLMAPGALERVMRELKDQPQADLYFGEKEDFYLIPDRPMRFRRIMALTREAVFDFRNEKTVDEYFRNNRKLIAYCNFISNIIFRREKWVGIKTKERFVGTAYIHLYVFQSILWGFEPGIMKYLPLPLVKRRWGNDGSVDSEGRLKVDVQMYRRIAAAVFADKKYVSRIDEMVLINDGFSWAVRGKIEDRWNFYFRIFPFLWGYYWKVPLFWLKIVPLLFVPNFILKILRGSYRKLIKGEPLSAREILEI